MGLLSELNAENFIFQTFDDSEKKDGSLVRQFYGTLEAHETALQHFNRRGAGIYVTINECREQSREKSDVVKARALWIDQDDEKALLPQLTPSIIVETSKSKHHYYWIISNPTSDLALWDSVESELVRKTKTDPSVKDRSRVMRVPGFYNMKDPANPFLVTEEVCHQAYTWETLTEHFKTYVEKSIEKAKKNRLDTAIDGILTGSNFNDSLGTLTQHMANKHYTSYHIESVMQGLMALSSERGSSRHTARVNHIKKQVSTAIKKAYEPVFTPKNRDKLKDLGVKITKVRLPPGMVGSITKNVLDFMKYPNQEIAILTALHVLSVFAGRRYSCHGKSLTARRILLAPQSSGKNTTNKYLQSVIKELEKPGPDNQSIPKLVDARKLAISGDFTAVRPIHQELEEYATRSMILAEAGQVGMSETGDKSGVKGYMLQLLSSNSEEGILPKKYSIKATEKGLQSVYNPCAVILHESVPDNYISVLSKNNEFTDGSMARSDLIYTVPNRSKENKNREAYKAKISPHILEFLASLGHLNLSIPTEGTKRLDEGQLIYTQPESSDIKDMIDAYDDKIDALLDEAKTEIQVALNARKLEKFYITVQILAIGDDPETPIITKEHVDWVIDYQDAMAKTVESLGTSGELADPLDAACNSMESKIINILSNPGKAYFGHGGTSELLQYQCIPRSVLTSFLGHDKFLKAYSDAICYRNKKRATNDILEELEAKGIVRVHKKASTRQERPDYLVDFIDGSNKVYSGEYIQYLYML